MTNDLGPVPKEFHTILYVVPPFGVTAKLGKVCKDCSFTLKNRDFPTNLIVLSMSKFDTILGIDWLTKYGAILDCASKSIKFTMPRALSFKFQYEPTRDAFLTTHLVTIKSTREENTLTEILIVQDFEDVFHDILRLPLEEKDKFLYRVGTRNITKF